MECSSRERSDWSLGSWCRRRGESFSKRGGSDSGVDCKDWIGVCKWSRDPSDSLTGLETGLSGILKVFFTSMALGSTIHNLACRERESNNRWKEKGKYMQSLKYFT